MELLALSRFGELGAELDLEKRLKLLEPDLDLLPLLLSCFIIKPPLFLVEVLEALRQQFRSGPAAAFHEFLSGGQRGFTLARRTPPGATLPLNEPTDTELPSLRRIG